MFIYHYCCFEHKQVIIAFMSAFIVYCTVSYIFERLFKPSGTGPNVLKSLVHTLIRLYLLTGDIFDKLRQRHSTIRTWDSDTRIGIISLATESKRIVCNLPFENQLFAYIHYCTEISEININLLPNTCNFHPKFWFIFSLHLSENAQNVHFREARFQNFPGVHAPEPP